jgi:CRP/FNR family cyclic AMP-dependent transcriptional regulator
MKGHGMPEFLSSIAQNLMLSLSTVRGTVQLMATLTGLGLLVIASFVRTMVPLRMIAVASNISLLIAGALALSPVHILVYLGLIPLNTWRLMEIKRLTLRVEKASADGDLSGIWLKPYMKARRLKAGATLFRKGDKADSLYLLVDGELELLELGKTQAPGELFGEISFFSPDRCRTLTARCATDCLVLSIAEPAFKQLYFQNPKFAFQISNLIAYRLSADVERLRRQLQGLQADSQAEAAAAACVPAADSKHAQPLGVA